MGKKIQLKNVRLSFADIWTARAFEEGAEPKYGATFLVEKGSENDKAIQAAIKEVAKEAWGAKADSNLAKIKGNPNKEGYRDGDTQDYDGYANNNFIRASGKVRPTIVNKNRSPLTEADGVIYSGCYVNAIIDIYAYDSKGVGISAGLKGIQFVKDGEAFSGGGVASADDFDDIEEGADAEDFV